MNPAILTAIDNVLEWAMGHSDTPSVRELLAQRDAAVTIQEALLDKVAKLSPRQREVATMLATAKALEAKREARWAVKYGKAA